MSQVISKDQNIQLKVQVWLYCILRSGEIKVLLFKTTPERGGFWQPVTGSVEPQEALLDAASREALEESGFQNLKEPVSLQYTFSFEARGKQIRETAFMCEVSEENSREPAPTLDFHEHVESKWLGMAEANAELRFESNRVALKHLREKLARKKL